MQKHPRWSAEHREAILRQKAFTRVIKEAARSGDFARLLETAVKMHEFWKTTQR